MVLVQSRTLKTVGALGTSVHVVSHYPLRGAR